MERPKCGTCPYWELLDDNSLDEVSLSEYKALWGENKECIGECRRFPRSNDFQYAARNEWGKLQHSGETSHVMSNGTHTCDFDWCGEHPDFPAYLASLKTSVPAEVEALEMQLAGDGRALLVLRTALKQGMTIPDFTIERLAKEIRNCGVVTARKIMTAIAAEKATDAIRKSAPPSCEASS
jgi:hypothetical protein